MKFREIKPGMVISWKTEDEKAALLEELERLGYVWYGTKRKPTGGCYDNDTGHAIHVYNDSGYKNITHSNKLEKVTHEFSDLIIPELELSAEEVLMLRGTICEEKNCGYCPLSKYNNGEGETCNKFLKNHAGKAVELLAKWKSDHENKEPEIETVDVCRIIKILPDRKMVVHEEDIKSELPFGGDERQKVEEILKHYCMEHDGEYIAVHAVVSRVKAVA